MPIYKSMQNSWIDHKCSAILEYNWSLLTQHSDKIDSFFHFSDWNVVCCTKILCRNFYDSFCEWQEPDSLFFDIYCRMALRWHLSNLSVIFCFVSCSLQSILFHEFVSICFFSYHNRICPVRIMRLFETFKSTFTLNFIWMNPVAIISFII